MPKFSKTWRHLPSRVIKPGEQINAKIQKGKNSSFAPDGPADFSNHGYRLAKRERHHWWTVGPALDRIFVQKAICRKTSVYWPPPRPSEGTAGADTSCLSTPTWLSARRTPSLPALCVDTSAGISGGKRCRKGRQWRPFKGDIDTPHIQARCWRIAATRGMQIK